MTTIKETINQIHSKLPNNITYKKNKLKNLGEVYTVNKE